MEGNYWNYPDSDPSFEVRLHMTCCQYYSSFLDEICYFHLLITAVFLLSVGFMISCMTYFASLIASRLAHAESSRSRLWVEYEAMYRPFWIPNLSLMESDHGGRVPS